MKKYSIFTFSLFLIVLFLSGCESKMKTQITKMQCEYLDSPLGIDAVKPRFTWLFEGDAKDFIQKAYQIEIASSPDRLSKGEADIWTSPKIEGSVPYADYAGDKDLESHKKYYWKVTVWGADDKEIVSKSSTFETAKLAQSDWVAKWITDGNDKEFEPAPMFRKTFDLNKKIISARAYVTAAGYYELFLNGKRVGDHYLDPGYTVFDKRILYSTYDITDLLVDGQNAVAGVLGNGWYNCQSKSTWDFDKAYWRNRPRIICELRVVYEDGTSDIIVTDGSWKTATGPYTYNNLYSGDKYDARLEEAEWNNINFDDSKWAAAEEVESPTLLLKAQQMPPIRITKEFNPVSMKSFGDTVYVFDMGENFTGFCRLTVKGESGTTFRLQHGELLKQNGRLEPGNIDVYYHPVKKDEVFQTDIFTLRGLHTEEVFTPQFTYHGFRYVEVKIDRPVKLAESNIKGLFVHTDVKPVGSFSCSNELFNKIWKATMQSYLSNLHSIPTDCPQREKNGWVEDACIAMDLALLNYDGITFYEKWLTDFSDSQRADGNVPGIAPTASWGYEDWIGPVWGTSLFIMPNTLYNYYGDKRAIENLYPAMERYMTYLRTREKEGMLTYGIGDWVYYKTYTSETYTSTLHYYIGNKLMSRFAKLLGKDAKPYETKADELKKLINEKFFDAEKGTYAGGTQAAQAVALYDGIVPEGKEELVAKVLNDSVVANNYFLDYGLLGSKTVPRMLTKYGYVETAYKMANKTEAPSWGYWIEQGYTTLPETWTLSPEFRDASLNHVFMGDISAWMTNDIAGINYDEQNPGFRNIIIRPHFIKDLQWAKAEYNSISGLIKSEWKRNGDNILLTVHIPLGAKATIYADKEHFVGSGVYEYSIKQ